MAYTTTLPLPGDTTNVLLKKLLQLLGGSPPCCGADDAAVLRDILLVLNAACTECTGGGGGGSGSAFNNKSGAGSPVGVETPNYIGQWYLDTNVPSNVWISNGLTNVNWLLVVGEITP